MPEPTAPVPAPGADGSAGPIEPQLLASAGTFVSLVEAGNFGRAGQLLGLTQSGVSKALARLERRLGTRLLQRHTRSLQLTADGLAFFEAVRPLVRGIEGATRRAMGASASACGLIRVCVDLPFGHSILTPNVVAFLEREAGIDMELIVRPHLGDLVAEKLDLAIRFGPPAPSGLVVRKLAETRVLTCAAPGYLRRKGTPASPWALESAHHDCILLTNADTGRPYAWDFVRDGASVRVGVNGRLTVAEPISRVAACRAGFGIAQMLELYGAPHLADGSLVQILPDWAEERWPLFAYLPSRHQVPARVRRFLDFVVSLTQDGPLGGAPLPWCRAPETAVLPGG